MLNEEMRFRNLNVVLKISERCNIACDYCYFFFNNDQSWRKHPPSISLETVKYLADFLRNAALDKGITRATIVLHGGEPLLMKQKTFEALCKSLRSAESDNFKLNIVLQTNGMLINEKWIDIFERNNIGVGISLDGTKDVNDLHRLDKKGRSTYDATVRGLTMLSAAAEAGRISSPGLLSVVNAGANGADAYYHFSKYLNVKFIDFLLPDYTHDDLPSSETPDAIKEFILGAVRAWLRDGKDSVSVRTFSEVLAALSQNDAAKSASDFRNDYRHMISVSSNGDIGPEDTLKILDEKFTNTGLNVKDHTIRDVLDHPVWKIQREAAEQRPVGCDGCVWWKICKGGRPVNRYSRSNGFANSSVFCGALKELHSEICAFLISSGIDENAIEQRLEIA